MNYEFRKSIEIARAEFDPNYLCRCQHYSFAWYRGTLLAFAKNNPKTHPLNIRNPLKFHTGEINYTKGTCSELALFIKLKNKTNIPFSKITIINVRIDRNLNLSYSKPCNSCESLIRYIKPKTVFFTDFNGQFEQYTIE